MVEDRAYSLAVAGADSLRLTDNTVSVIVPTYREAENIPVLIERLERVRARSGLDLELILCDDDSRDGTLEVVRRASKPWVRLLIRTRDRGLSPAVLDGLQVARHERLIVMDADLSHPPEKIPEMLAELGSGADFVIGSRYADGGSTDAAWGPFRWLNSKVATLLARPFTTTNDPMSGFFALSRTTLNRGAQLNPVGYKIGLELLVKCRCRRVSEVPIHFTDRTLGESKLTLREQLRYIQHLRRLLIFKHPNWSYMLQFAFVGSTGAVINLATLTALAQAGVPDSAALLCAIIVSFFGNFLLNRRFTFSYARAESASMQLFGFAAACALGLITNYGVSLLFRREFPLLPIQVAAAAGILAGTGFNYLTSRYLVFKKREPSRSALRRSRTGPTPSLRGTGA